MSFVYPNKQSPGSQKSKKAAKQSRRGKMNKPKQPKITYRRYLGPALYDLIYAERQERAAALVTTGQLAKLAKEEV